MDEQARPPLDLKSALGILRRRWAWVLIPAILLTSLQVVRSERTTPMYATSAELLLQGRSTDALLSGIDDPNRVQAYTVSAVLATEIRIVQSDTLRRRVSEQLGYPAFVIGSGDDIASVMNLTARDSNPRRAAETANAFAQAYIDYRREQSIADLDVATAELKRRVAGFQNDIDRLTARLTDPANAAPAIASAITAQRESLIKSRDNFQTRIDALSVDASLKSGGASILTPAEEPSVPYSPRPARSAATGLLSGLVLGLGLAFLRDFLDDRIRNKEDLNALAPSVPVLGVIPKMRRLTRRRLAKLGRHAAAVPPEAVEAYRSLRSAITFLSVDKPVSVIQVTSPHSGEGKSTTARNLARVMSQTGFSVLVIDGDMRSPTLHGLFGVGNDHGFSDLLAGRLGIAAASQTLALDDDLTVLPAGPTPPNPAELLGSKRAKDVMQAVGEHYDVVLIDGPPVLAVTDPVVISNLVDATIVVTKSGTSTREDTALALEVLEQANANVIGFVLNGIDTRRRYGRYAYGRYGRYGYGARRAKAPVPVPPMATMPVWVPDEDPIWTTGPSDPAWAPHNGVQELAAASAAQTHPAVRGAEGSRSAPSA
jgi:polysaccharide biosynthesis transport protein